MKIIKEKENRIDLGKGDYLTQYLVNLGISAKDVPSFINEPKMSDEDNPYNLDNMERGLNLMKQAIDNNYNIYLQPDCDVDGFTSAAIFYQYFKVVSPQINFTYHVHEGKEHGVEVDKIPENTQLVVIPDAGSMQLDEQKELAAKGIYVLILDHHEVTDMIKDDKVVLINNQSSTNFTNKQLSGAGIVYMFIKAFDEKYYDGLVYQNYTDLAALGIIADMMDTKVLGNNYIIYHGLNHIVNKTFQAALKHQQYKISDIGHPNKIDIAFYIAPLINGLIRSGKQEEKELFFKAMLDNNSTELIDSVYRGKIRVETIYDNVVRLAANAKARQDAAKKHSSELLNNEIEKMGLDKHKLLIVPIVGADLKEVPSTLTGLTAMELMKRYNKPTMVLRENIDKETEKITYSGSLRSKNFYGFNSFVDFINKSGLANYAEGHDNAAGVSFDSTKLQQFINYSDSALKNVDFNNDYIEVDYWFKSAINIHALEEVAKANRLWGNGIPQPKFAFTIPVHANEISLIGKDSDTIKFTYENVDFVMFKQPKIARILKYSVNNDITCVGRAQINDFNNQVQIIIDDIDIKEGEVNSALDLL